MGENNKLWKGEKKEVCDKSNDDKGKRKKTTD